MTTVVISAVSDIATDQRVKRAAATLNEAGYRVHVVGRKLKDSLKVESLPYQVTRFRLWNNKGPLFYAEYNIRLFFYLLFNKADILNANDLDTLAANYLVSILKGIPVIYDSHEYFTGVPEIQHRPFVKKTWETIEKTIFPRVAEAYTVNNSIASIYAKKYNREVHVIRNLPDNRMSISPGSRQMLNLPADKKIIVLQGAGINVDRGAEEAVEAMLYLDNTLLLIIGSGDVIPQLKEKVKNEKYRNKVRVLGKMPWEKLMQYTTTADLGITLDKDTNLNYRYSLPNKLFDYINAGVPVLSSKLIEIENIIIKYDVGTVVDSHDPEKIASAIRDIWNKPEQLKIWKNNTLQAATELQWKNEAPALLKIYEGVVAKTQSVQQKNP